MASLALPDRLNRLPLLTIVAVLALGGFSLLVLYSAAGGNLRPWALNQGIRFSAMFVMMLGISQLDMRIWMRFAYPIYGVCLILLLAVEIIGQVGGGSQRWLNLGIINLQPSELMKIAVVLAMARYYHFLPRANVRSWKALVFPATLLALPAALVMLQPDLGTALAILFGGTAIVFLGGASGWLFIAGGALAIVGVPLAVKFLLHGYQQKRVLIFLDPEADPLGAGYHITQSKIAIGSGGIDGKGFMSGTQSHLQYLPELHTDFIFATMSEEWGLIGGLFVIACFTIIIARGVGTALTARTIFAQLVAMGMSATLFFYVFVNLAMVMGFAPVVGIPLPLMSYGGSAMLTATLLVGILLSVHGQRDRTRLTEGPGRI